MTGGIGNQGLYFCAQAFSITKGSGVPPDPNIIYDRVPPHNCVCEIQLHLPRFRSSEIPHFQSIEWDSKSCLRLPAGLCGAALGIAEKRGRVEDNVFREALMKSTRADNARFFRYNLANAALS